MRILPFTLPCALLLAACPGPSQSADAAVVNLVDAGHPAPDAGAPDAALPDAALPDAALPPDAGVPDAAAVPDAAGALDAALPPDAGAPDAALPDAAAPDAGGADAATGYGPAGTPFPIVGFGEGTLGGWQDGHDNYVVTSLSDTGAGSLREGLATGGAPRVITFETDGPINLATPLLVPSNITIDGRGHLITLRLKGMVIPGSDQVILVNLAFEDVGPDTEDGVQIGSALPDPSEHVVLDHLRFTQHGNGGSCENVDEAISVVFGSRNITLAWCRFDAWEKVLLAGNGDAEPSLDSQITVTVHHSYANSTGRRHPQARLGHFHLFNNFLDDWHMYGWFFADPYFESFGHQVQDSGRMLLEGEMVRRTAHEFDSFSQADEASRCEASGDLQEHGTWVDPSTSVTLKFGVGCLQEQSFLPPYVYAVETAGAELRDRVVAGSGNTL